MNPSVSIIIPTYNHGHFVVFAVESALAQTCKNTEVLVIDDGSTDNTREVLTPFGDRITVIHQENRGLSAARNAGIRTARGAFIALLDADDLWLPEKLDAQMKVFAEYPDTGLVSCGNVSVDDQGREVSSGWIRGSAHFRFRHVLSGNCVSGGSNAVIRRTCFETVGLFDETLRSSEDWDMWLRIARQYPVRFVPQVLTKIRVSPNSMSAAKNADIMLSNELRVLGKLFADPTAKVSAYDRGMAYASRYVAAAKAYREAGNRRAGGLYLRKAFRANPVHFLLRRSFCGLAIRIVLGRAEGKPEFETGDLSQREKGQEGEVKRKT
jgi:glycosyltransferase involved in cell wall biosynthesis